MRHAQPRRQPAHELFAIPGKDFDIEPPGAATTSCAPGRSLVWKRKIARLAPAFDSATPASATVVLTGNASEEYGP
jgi:hypothetical protein